MGQQRGRRFLAGLWRMPGLVGVSLGLLVQLLVVAVIWEGWIDYRRHVQYVERRSDVGPPAPFDLEQWRYFARDRLQRTWARVLAPSFPASGDGIETVQLRMDAERVAQLDRDLLESGRERYVPAVLMLGDGVAREARARYTGDNHWHWFYPQKSWKVRMPRREAVRDRSAFQLKNPPSLLTIDEPLVSALARELGLLAPVVRPVKLLHNDSYAGLYLWWDAVDESLLRRQDRMPGSLYSGDGAPPDPRDGVSSLWREPARWRMDASRNAGRGLDRSDLETLIAAVNTPDPLAFHAFAARHLDLKRYALAVALDRAFGCAHHDHHHNHKLYYDPYRGRWEPVVWDLNDWMLSLRPERFDNSLNPLLFQVRRHPVFDRALKEALHGVLRTVLSPESVEARMRALAAATEAARAADFLRDTRDFGAVRLGLAMPHSRYYGMDDYRAAVEEKLAAYAARHARLLGLLEESTLELHLARDVEGQAVLDLYCGGRVGQSWSALRWPGVTGPAVLHADRNGDGELDASDPVVGRADVGRELAIDLAEDLYPGLSRVPLSGVDPLLHGLFDLAPAPLRYRYFLVGPAALPEDPELVAERVLGGGTVKVRRLERPPETADWSLHPWRLPPAPAARTVELGPGEVIVREDRRYGPETELVVAPGTRVLLGPGVSIVCEGRVRCVGTEREPIELAPVQDGTAWGVFALHGPGTADSEIAHSRFRGGAGSILDQVEHPGMVDLCESDGILVRDCVFEANRAGDAALHGSYLRGAVFERCTFRDAPADAFDLDLCRDVRVSDCVFFDSGNDGLDLMATVATVADCVFAGSGDKGICVGEGSTVEVLDCELRRCTIGIQVRDRSLLTGGRIGLTDCATGIDCAHENLRYSQGGRCELGEVRIRGAQTPLQVGELSHAVVEPLFVDGRRTGS